MRERGKTSKRDRSPWASLLDMPRLRSAFCGSTERSHSGRPVGLGGRPLFRRRRAMAHQEYSTPEDAMRAVTEEILRAAKSEGRR